jgi:hypothetical protein
MEPCTILCIIQGTLNQPAGSPQTHKLSSVRVTCYINIWTNVSVGILRSYKYFILDNHLLYLL